MKPEEKARLVIDRKLGEAGWIVQDMNHLNPWEAPGVAVEEYPTDSGPVDYALFVDGQVVGLIEAKRREAGENLIHVEEQAERYATSQFHYVEKAHIRFLYEATDEIIRFTDREDIDYCSRQIFSFLRPETIRLLLSEKDTLRNRLKQVPLLDSRGFRACQIRAIEGLTKSFAENRPRALVQMATGAGKTFTAITEAYRLLKYGKMKRILFLVDTKSLGEQAEREFMSYVPNDDARTFSELYTTCRLKRSFIPQDAQVCISTIQRMYSILSGEVLDETVEEEPLAEVSHVLGKKKREVLYNANYPPEFFDCIIVDECHRSIYNIWSQVLEYFDAFLIGLTATPDTRTYGYFHENEVSHYTREEAILDGVNVGEDIFTIETEISQHGGHIMKQEIDYRERESRVKTRKLMDADVDYAPSQLDKEIVNPSQIRTVIRTFKANVSTIFPGRREVPKTLIFAKTDSHADDIIQIVREEFGKGNEFCKKITYSADNPEAALRSFRNDFNPRIAVTVNMIATGTDVKPIECLIFMRDVRSANYFEQMKGRGTRTLSKEDLQKVSPSATGNKDHFVIIDAVGVTKSKKSVTRTLERKPTVSMKELLLAAAMGTHDENILTSLAGRLARLNANMDSKEKKHLESLTGKSVFDLPKQLLNAFDKDRINEKAKSMTGKYIPDDRDLEQAKDKMIEEAISPFRLPEVRDYIENVRKCHSQIIDTVNQDKTTFVGWDKDQKEKAKKYIDQFHHFIEEHKEEILALRIIYDQRYKDRAMVIEQLKALYEKLKGQGLTVSLLYNQYQILEDKKEKKSSLSEITDLISLIRYEMGAAKDLHPFAEVVDANYKHWIFDMNHREGIHLTEAQHEWLRLIRDHIKESLSITTEDLELTPFDAKGGLGAFYQAFGSRYEDILREMNEALVV